MKRKIIFRLDERLNLHRQSGKEWALNVRFSGNGTWTMKTWEHKPSEKVIEETKNIVIRAFEFYHSNMEVPPYFEIDDDVKIMTIDVR
jgi:hypothetical protein